MAKLKKTAMEIFPTSIRLPRSLYKSLEQKSEEMGGIGISKTVQILLEPLLRGSFSKKQTHDTLQKQSSIYGVMTYFLMEKLVAGIENGQILRDEAHAKAEEVVKDLLQQIAE